MNDKTMRVSTEPLARARKALNTLLMTRKLNFLVDHGAIYFDRRASKLPGSDGLAQLLATTSRPSTCEASRSPESPRQPP